MNSNLENSLLDKWRQKSVSENLPLQASLELTFRCNERCTHCYIEDFSDNKERLLNLDQWKKVLDELRSSGTLYIILMGGEPLLSPQFWGVAEYASKLGFHVSMISNGLLVKTKEVAQRLKAVGLMQVTMSFYSIYSEIHEKMTQVKGSYKKTKNAIEWCQEVGLDVAVNCLLTKENIETVFDLEDWCVEKKLEMKVDPFITPTLEGGKSPTLLRPSREQLKYFYSERFKRWPNSKPQKIKIESGGYVCNAAKGKCAITPYGDLLPCIEIREELGNLSVQSFQEIWASPTAQKWRHIFNKDLKDLPSDGLESFCDHCPGMAEHETGDPHQVLDFAHELAAIKSEVGL